MADRRWKNQRAVNLRHSSEKNKKRFLRWLRGDNCCNLSASMKTFLLPAYALMVSTVMVFSENVIAPGAKLEKLAGDFAFTEGPTCDANGNVFFTDQPNDRIMRWSVDGKLSVFMQPAGRANGMYFDANGNLIACADEHNQLWSIAPDKSVTVLVTNFEGKYLNGPNDVWVAPNGGMYISDPFYKRNWWDHTAMALTNEEVYYLSPDRKNLVRVTDDLKKPNGITGTPDGKNLFVSDIQANQTWRYDIQLDGSLTNKTFICALGSDGMTIDAEGNLYLTGHGVTVFDKTGKKIDHIDINEPWTANVSFGGKDHQTLFITASKSFYSIRLNVKGANPAK
jgi:gluconolactonase